MLRSLVTRLKRKMLRSDARQYVMICRSMSSQPQLSIATELTNILRLRMIRPKCELLLKQAFKAHWDTRMADQYVVSTQGHSLLELTQDLRQVTGMLEVDHAISRDNIYTTTKDVLLGTYLTQHDGIFTDPYEALTAFHKASIEFSKALQFYLDRNPDTERYTLRIMSGYTVSLNNILDDLIELQCDFLSP